MNNSDQLKIWGVKTGNYILIPKIFAFIKILVNMDAKITLRKLQIKQITKLFNSTF